MMFVSQNAVKQFIIHVGDLGLLSKNVLLELQHGLSALKHFWTTKCAWTPFCREHWYDIKNYTHNAYVYENDTEIQPANLMTMMTCTPFQW